MGIPTMKVVLGLFCLAVLTSAQPQRGLQGLIDSPSNPCGQGVRPTCICKSDASFQPSPRNPCPAGRDDLECTCSNGNIIDYEAVKQQIRESLKNSDKNPCGAGNEPVCLCSDGSEALFSSGPPCPGATHEERHPKSCPCPNGLVLDPKELHKTLRNAFRLREKDQ